MWSLISKTCFVLTFQKYGVTLRAQARFQMNVIIDKNDGFDWFNNIMEDKIYYPFMWLDEGISGPSEVRKKISAFRGLWAQSSSPPSLKDALGTFVKPVNRN